MFLLSACALSSCAGPDARSGYGDHIIEEPGVYIFPEHNLKLTVSKAENALVSVAVTDTLNKPWTQDTFPRFPMVDEWALYVDTSATVWLQSAEMGTYTLSKVDGAYAVTAFILTRNNQRSLPNALRTRLPSSLNRRINN